MTESFVTQCPHCRTSFRVNLAQLGAARGVVRCGACLHLFNAAQQLLERGQQLPAITPRPTLAPTGPAAAPTAQIEPEQSAQQQKSDSDTLWIHDDLDLDDLDLDEELAKLEEQEQQLSQQFLALQQTPEHSEPFRPAADSGTHDEDWAEALLQEDSPQAPSSPGDAAQAPTPATTAPVTEQAADPAVRDIPPLKLSALETQDPQPALDEPGLSAQRDDPDLDLDALDTPDERQPEPAAQRQPSNPTTRSEPGLRDEHLLELDDEPLQLDWQPARKPWGRWLGWGLLNLLAATALIAQHIHYNFAELARQDQYRPWFEQLCPIIGCTLPSKVDISQIKSSNLVVRSHPEFSGALVVDAILYNRAPFAQPFPLLEMRFADINGRLLASRRFKPSEYLAGELAGQAEMPPQTPIHVSLDILDPGNQAVNYSLSFHSPE
ncbi:DUF3426 domain-containing protein [Pseudomonas borbori]|uniref:MJ0042 family finger-like domain-containing protein n=1 Tax=Pseudomonas borbori TaxID=289003 RepID=A0A1I5S9M3_9PSED|nr:DUF3426 domain-containing protein [Pseudomonas borbori]SFP67415.1 MJ0042 family finger-like domain-containing protein [Pseudomonas borbori]